MIKKRLAALAVAAFIAIASWANPAEAQVSWPTPVPNYSVGGVVQMCLNSSGQAVPVSSGNCANPVQVSGTFTASLGGFTPSASGARGTPLTVATSDTSGPLPTGAVDVVSNAGTTNPMYCNVNGVAATASDQYIAPSGGWFAFTIPSGVTTLHCIATGGSTTANMVGGSGLPTGTGGGSGGGGGSSAITTWAGGSLGAMATYGTSPGAVLVPGMNAFVTNTVAVSGTFWQATQPISAASLPLPTGAATAANQSSSGSDGSTAITTGGTAQNLFSGSTPTHGWEVCNPNVSDDLWVSQSTTAAINGQGSMRIGANGGCVSSVLGMAPFHAISIIGPTTSDKITAVRW